MFAIHIIKNDKKITFREFKIKLRSYKSREQFNSRFTNNTVMKLSVSVWRRDKEDFELILTCYNCGQKEHSALVRAEDRNNGKIFVSASLIKMLTADKGRGTMQNKQTATHLHSN